MHAGQAGQKGPRGWLACLLLSQVGSVVGALARLGWTYSLRRPAYISTHLISKDQPAHTEKDIYMVQ